MAAMGAPFLLVDPGDSVATALRDVPAGETLLSSGLTVTAAAPIPRGHKIAVRAIAAGEVVHKYGFPIGRARNAIAPGEHVHTHNLATALGLAADYAYAPSTPPKLLASPLRFQGYRRADGRVGTRNEIWVLPTVGCVARTAAKIAEAANVRHRGRVDGVHAFAHPFGCSQLGDDLASTRALLARLAAHPNAGGALIVALGCESNQADALLDELEPAARDTVRVLYAQSASDELAEGAALVDELIERAVSAHRSEASLGELVLGVKCGGSDGLSGLTANPLVGRAADAVAGAGGSVILTEVPEIFGAEHLLLQRAQDERVFQDIVALVTRFKAYFADHGEPVSENPSPGNIAGGITTLEEKSLGAVQKGGRALVTDVLRYGERVRKGGLSLLEAPGNDAVSSTALAAAGATLILFTTGRGTPLGFPAPTVKISSNSALAERKPGWIDFDAGAMLERDAEELAQSLLEAIAAFASGKQTAAERNGEREIAIWKRGVTL